MGPNDKEVLQKITETQERLARFEGRLAPILELKDDLQPIVREFVHTLIVELDELDGHFRLEDGLFLLKKLLRNTKNIAAMLERLEQVDDMIRDFSPIFSEATKAAIMELGALEQQGVFRNLAALREVAESFSRRYTPDRVVSMGEALIELTDLIEGIAQPKTLSLMRAAADAATSGGESRNKITFVGLLRRMRDPETLRGLALMLDIAKALGQVDDRDNQPMLQG